MTRNLFAELRRRNVFRAAALYIGAVWALTQGIAHLTPVVGAPDWAARWFLVAAVIGFPFWIAFAWYYPAAINARGAAVSLIVEVRSRFGMRGRHLRESGTGSGG